MGGIPTYRMYVKNVVLYKPKVYLTSPEPSTVNHNSLIFY